MKYMTLGKKIALGFGGLIGIAFILGGIAIYNMKSAESSANQLATEFVPESVAAGLLESSVASVQLSIRSYGYTGEAIYLEDARKGLDKVHGHHAEAQKLADMHPNLVKLREHLKVLAPELKNFEETISQTEAKNKDIASGRNDLNTAAANFQTDIDTLITTQNGNFEKEIQGASESAKLQERREKVILATDIRSQGTLAREAAFKSQAMRDPAIMEAGIKIFDSMDEKFDQLLAKLHVAEEVTRLNKLKGDAHAYRDAMKKITADNVRLSEIGKLRIQAGEQLKIIAAQILETGMKGTVEATNSSSQKLSASSWMMTVGVGVSMILGIAVAWVIIKGTTKILTKVSSALDEGSVQIASASNQVSSASQSLAEGASEQAASLEETSSSLEEMASMTARNSENAQKATDLARETRTAADKGATEMQTMSAAMDAIKDSSNDIAKIIKTIDEIAFQTNILALNAAVEAARAGEAGRGFAVVADEVRNLAQRSAQAAKETAAKIEGAITKTGQGVEISAKVKEALNDIVTKVRKVDELVSEVASASREQTQGISQINTAVGQMDKVTQGTAATAEETAAAAEELNAQAASMKGSVSELLKLVGGASQASAKKSSVLARPIQTHAFDSNPKNHPILNGHGNGKGHSNGIVKNGKNGSHAEPAILASTKGRESIPMDEDFRNF